MMIIALNQLYIHLNNREPMETEIVDNLKDKIDVLIIKQILDEKKYLTVKINYENDVTSTSSSMV